MNFSNVSYFKIAKMLDEILLKCRGLSGPNVCKSCRSRQEFFKEYVHVFSSYYLLAQIGVDIAENEPLKVPDDM